MASEAVQVGRSVVIHTMTGGGCPADPFPSVAGCSLAVVGSTMRLAGTKYVRHGVGVGTFRAIKFPETVHIHLTTHLSPQWGFKKPAIKRSAFVD